jgi:hypothetical protein
MTCSVLLKLVALLGMGMTAGGTIFLWRRSPSGYALGGYAGGDVLAQNDKNNQRLARGQYVAISLIFAGTLLQVPALFFS